MTVQPDPRNSSFRMLRAFPLVLASLLAVPLPSQAQKAIPAVSKPAPTPAATLLPSDPVPFLQDDQYILGPGDGLDLKFLALGSSKDALSGPLQILPDGTVSAPLLGSVRLTGLTLSQATLWLQSLYKRQLLRPELQLTLNTQRPLRLAILGEVERPGIYTLSVGGDASNTAAPVSISGMPTVVDAIQKAGGVTNLADLTQVTIRRRMPGEPQQYRRTQVDLLALIRDGELQQNPLLFDGDTIRVGKAAETVPEAVELSSTTLSPKEISVNLIGEVKSPGLISVPANTPLVQAVLAAGGPATWRANTSRVQLIRINRNGSLTRRAYALNINDPPSNASNPPLRDRDTVIVGRSNLAKFSDTLDAIGQPLSSLANVLSLMQILRNTGNN